MPEKVKEVYYYTYNLAGIKFFNAATHLQHAGVCIIGDEGSQIEFNMTDKGLVSNACGEYRPGHAIGKYALESDTKNLEYEAFSQQIRDKYANTTYKLGSNDCWGLVEGVAAMLGLDKANLAGPIGARSEIGNGGRFLIRVAEDFLSRLLK